MFLSPPPTLVLKFKLPDDGFGVGCWGWWLNRRGGSLISGLAPYKWISALMKGAFENSAAPSTLWDIAHVLWAETRSSPDSWSQHLHLRLLILRKCGKEVLVICNPPCMATYDSSLHWPEVRRHKMSRTCFLADFIIVHSKLWFHLHDHIECSEPQREIMFFPFY